MITHANTKFSLLRGSDVGEFGDEVDNNLVAASGIPGAKKELFSRAPRETNPDQRLIRRFRIRLPRRTVVYPSDRLGDEWTGDILLVDDIERPATFGLAQDIIITATLVESVIVPLWPVGQSFNPFVGYYVYKDSGPVSSITVNHNLGYPHHTSVFVGGELVLATVTPALDYRSTLVEFDDPQSNVEIVCSL